MFESDKTGFAVLLVNRIHCGVFMEFCLRWLKNADFFQENHSVAEYSIIPRSTEGKFCFLQADLGLKTSIGYLINQQLHL